MKYLDRIANAAVIVGVAVFLVIAIRGGLFRRQPSLNSPASFLGKTISLPGVRFPKHDSFVLAISTTCHFCKESLPFYKELATRSEGKADVYAVLPQPQTDANSFIQQAEIPSAHVVSVSLDTIGVHGTPTLFVVDSGGKIKDAWIGLLNDQAKQKVFSEIPE